MLTAHPLLLECRSNEQSAYLLFFEFFLVYFHGNNSFMVCAADNQIFTSILRALAISLSVFKVWLNRITAPFTYSTIGFSNLFSKPFSCFLLFCEYYFKSVEISHRVKYFNHNAKLYNLSDMDATSYNNYYQEVGIWLS